MPHLTHRDYSHRDVIDKLGVKPGHAIALVHLAFQLDATLCRRVMERAGRPPAAADEVADIVLIAVDSTTAVSDMLGSWRPRIQPAGGIWLLTPKRGRSGYINQNDLILDGIAAGLVDNKTCSVSDEISGIRFVIRKVDRPVARPTFPCA